MTRFKQFGGGSFGEAIIGLGYAGSKQPYSRTHLPNYTVS